MMLQVEMPTAIASNRVNLPAPAPSRFHPEVTRHGRSDPSGYLVSCRTQGTRVSFHAAPGHRQRLVSQKVPDHEGVEPGLAAAGSDCVPEIVQPRVRKLGARTNTVSGVF